MSATERNKGISTEQRVARYLRSNGYPLAQTGRSTTGGYQNGPDILGVPGFSVEVKNRKSLDIGAALKQAKSGDIHVKPLLIAKPYGVSEPGNYWAILYLKDFVRLNDG